MSEPKRDVSHSPDTIPCPPPEHLQKEAIEPEESGEFSRVRSAEIPPPASEPVRRREGFDTLTDLASLVAQASGS